MTVDHDGEPLPVQPSETTDLVTGGGPLAAYYGTGAILFVLGTWAPQRSTVMSTITTPGGTEIDY